MKTYSAKTNALAADAVLTAAVEEAVGLLRDARHLSGSLLGDLAPHDAHRILLAAGRSAELLLDRAQLATLPEVDA